MWGSGGPRLRQGRCFSPPFLLHTGTPPHAPTPPHPAGPHAPRARATAPSECTQTHPQAPRTPRNRDPPGERSRGKKQRFKPTASCVPAARSASVRRRSQEFVSVRDEDEGGRPGPGLAEESGGKSSGKAAVTERCCGPLSHSLLQPASARFAPAPTLTAPQRGPNHCGHKTGGRGLQRAVQ
uniref:Uncharacterized protein n=1 Tax=Knipowitschia caucasica TaxID=637954 RepID=A0AAV2LW37_KNICA